MSAPSASASAPAPSPPGAGCMNPADGSALDPVPPTSVAEVRAAAAAARAAQPAWGARTLDQRAATVHELVRAMLARRDEALGIMAREMGRSETECLMSELAGLVDFAKGSIRAARKALAPEPIKLSRLDYPGKRVVVEAVPRGVVGIIAPWNYPLSNFYRGLFTALLAGDGALLKPSEHTPRTGAWLHARCAEVLPRGLVGLAQGAGEVGLAVIDEVDAVVFTGSVGTGRKVSIRCAERLIPCSVELGGKDAAIVLADCDLERTVIGVAQWAMHNAGQCCAGIERVYVEEKLADEFVRRLGAVVGALRVHGGEGVSDLGPLQNAQQLGIVEAHVEDARTRGARVVTGGARTGRGLGYQPTVLDGCTDEMRVVREETFGPVVAVVRVRDAEEAVARANASSYGLNGSVWTRDLRRGEALARRLDVGVALVNNHAITGIFPETPWTGVKDTGPGVAASHHAFHTFVRRRTLLVDASRKPDPWWMPFDDNMRALGEALVARQLGSVGALIKLAGLVGKRVAAIRELARRGGR